MNLSTSKKKVMSNRYLSFISDEHFFHCISLLYNAYVSANSQLTKSHYYRNKADPLKLATDTVFNNLDEEALIKAEILRQADKQITNHIGAFHENILGGIDGFERGHRSGYDIKSKDDTLFAELKNKYNTMNSSAAESVYQKLISFADEYPKAKCYLVQIWTKWSINMLWTEKLNGKYYEHPRVYMISGDKFYSLLSGQDDALFQLYKALPLAISEFMEGINKSEAIGKNSTLEEIRSDASKSGRTVLDQIVFENFNYYLGFDKL